MNWLTPTCEDRASTSGRPATVTITVAGARRSREVRFPFHPLALAILRETVPEHSRRWDRLARVWTITDEEGFARFLRVAASRGFTVADADEYRDDAPTLGDVLSRVFGLDDEK
ncbi:hypothetical protein QNO21_07600 [Microbacterium sp. zg-Y818]|uniref:hypothetical protein n=1 Tax=unclassified Microbacterium TaxID=2609290 RepID=UPI00214B89EB|nr:MULTISPECIES: hypothetical protein [unclassified Microbacterium]MCR2801169.1 hypothetical protein [Microbacterium sp. zg.Y818]WIM21005.1 hypothetical protein QNO21_07600 [Microbacterium sp. zg-Y818]